MAALLAADVCRRTANERAGSSAAGRDDHARPLAVHVNAVPKLFVFDTTGRRTHVFYGAPPDLHEKIEKAVIGAAK